MVDYLPPSSLTNVPEGVTKHREPAEAATEHLEHSKQGDPQGEADATTKHPVCADAVKEPEEPEPVAKEPEQSKQHSPEAETGATKHPEPADTVEEPEAVAKEHLEHPEQSDPEAQADITKHPELADAVKESEEPEPVAKEPEQSKQHSPKAETGATKHPEPADTVEEPEPVAKEHLEHAKQSDPEAQPDTTKHPEPAGAVEEPEEPEPVAKEPEQSNQHSLEAQAGATKHPAPAEAVGEPEPVAKEHLEHAKQSEPEAPADTTKHPEPAGAVEAPEEPEPVAKEPEQSNQHSLEAQAGATKHPEPADVVGDPEPVAKEHLEHAKQSEPEAPADTTKHPEPADAVEEPEEPDPVAKEQEQCNQHSLEAHAGATKHPEPADAVGEPEPVGKEHLEHAKQSDPESGADITKHPELADAVKESEEPEPVAKEPEQSNQHSLEAQAGATKHPAPAEAVEEPEAVTKEHLEHPEQSDPEAQADITKHPELADAAKEPLEQGDPEAEADATKHPEPADAVEEPEPAAKAHLFNSKQDNPATKPSLQHAAIKKELVVKKEPPLEKVKEERSASPLRGPTRLGGVADARKQVEVAQAALQAAIAQEQAEQAEKDHNTDSSDVEVVSVTMPLNRPPRPVLVKRESSPPSPAVPRSICRVDVSCQRKRRQAAQLLEHRQKRACATPAQPQVEQEQQEPASNHTSVKMESPGPRPKRRRLRKAAELEEAELVTSSVAEHAEASEALPADQAQHVQAEAEALLDSDKDGEVMCLMLAETAWQGAQQNETFPILKAYDLRAVPAKLHVLVSSKIGFSFVGTVEVVESRRVRRASHITDPTDKKCWIGRLREGKPVYQWDLAHACALDTPRNIKFASTKWRNRHFWCQQKQLLDGVDVNVPAPSLHQTAGFFMQLLDQNRYAKLQNTAFMLNGYTLRLGTACSGTDICVTAVRSLLAAMNAEFQAPLCFHTVKTCYNGCVILSILNC